jgi:hypothetical protein
MEAAGAPPAVGGRRPAVCVPGGRASPPPLCGSDAARDAMEAVVCDAVTAVAAFFSTAA